MSETPAHPGPARAPDLTELTNRFKFHPADTDEKQKAHQSIRDLTAQLALHFNRTVPPGRELSTAITKLEEAMFWANAGIARPRPNRN